MLDTFTASLIEQIQETETRVRARRSEAQDRFEYAVAVLVHQLWKSIHTYPQRECRIHKMTSYYSRPRYRDPMLTYDTMMAAYHGLLQLGLITETNGTYDVASGTGILTRYAATPKMIDMLLTLNGHPAIDLAVEPTRETIILRKTVKRRSKETGELVRRTFDIPYEDTEKTIGYRANLSVINACLLRHWPDLEITDFDIPQLAKDVLRDGDREPVDFSKRTLVRIFTDDPQSSNDRFTLGGRFYRAWWQNVPKNYRMLITIDGERTSEADYSQFHPQLLYHMAGKDMGNTDAYDRVLDGRHRKLVKQAFNAMLQMSRFSPDGPQDDDFKAAALAAGITWATLRDGILEAHAPVADYFFKGIGNSLQFTDSCIAEKVMLEFAQRDIPVLPVHDSFVVNRHVEVSGDLEEMMRKAYFEVTGHRIGKIDTTLMSWSRGKQPSKIGDTVIKATKYVVRALSADTEKSGWAMRQRLFKERL